MTTEKNHLFMVGVSKFYDKKAVPKTSIFSYFYGAKIGSLVMVG